MIIWTKINLTRICGMIFHIARWIIWSHLIKGSFFAQIIIFTKLRTWVDICSQLLPINFNIRILGWHLLRSCFSTGLILLATLFFTHFMWFWLFIVLILLYRTIRINWILFSLTIIRSNYSGIIIWLMSYLFCHRLVRRLWSWLLLFIRGFWGLILLRFWAFLACQTGRGR